MDRKISELSGGEKQRVGLLRALLDDADVLILDEPTTGIDAKMEKEIVAYLGELIAKENKMMIVVTHKPEILSICNKVVELKP